MLPELPWREPFFLHFHSVRSVLEPTLFRKKVLPPSATVVHPVSLYWRVVFFFWLELGVGSFPDTSLDGVYV